MNRKIQTLFLSVLFLLVMSACGGGSGGGGGGGGGGGPGSGSAPIPDVAGTWSITETLTHTCSDANVNTWTATVTQNGSNVTVSGGGTSRSGTLNGNVLTWSGSYPEDGGTTTVSSLSLTFTGDTVTGTATWSWTDGSSSCSGTSSISGQRDSGSGTVPVAPSGLAAIVTSSGSIDLMWQDNADNEDGYVLERSEVSSTNGFNVVATLPADRQSYSDAGLTPATRYYYRVAASNTEGRSAYSNVASATTDAAPPIPPTAPSNLNGSATSSTSVNLFWTDRSDNESSFEVYRAVSPGGSFSFAQTVPADVTSATIDGLSPDTTYAFKVIAVNSAGPSVDSNIHEITTPPPPVTVPNAPSALAVGSATSSSLTLNWTDNSDNETGFRIYRSSSQSGTYSQIATRTGTSYTNTGLSASTTYWYKVAAYNDAGSSAQTPGVSGTTSSPPVTVPSPPTNPAVSNISSSSATLNWTDTSDNETGFQVGFCTGLLSVGGNGALSCLPGVIPGGGFNQIDQVGANVTSYTFTGLSAGTEYFRFVRAYNTAGSSANTGASFTTSLGQQTVTLQAIASNVVQSNSLDSSWANTAYPNTFPTVGIVWASSLSGFPSSLAFAGLVKFDVSTLQGRTIDAATLNLEANVAPPVGFLPQNFDIGTVATPWNPATVSWNNMANFQYYNAGWQRNLAYPLFSGQTYSIDLAAIVQSWANGTFANNGLGFLSSDYGVFPGNITSLDAYDFYVPTLTVTYH